MGKDWVLMKKVRFLRAHSFFERKILKIYILEVLDILSDGFTIIVSLDPCLQNFKKCHISLLNFRGFFHSSLTKEWYCGKNCHRRETILSFGWAGTSKLLLCYLRPN